MKGEMICPKSKSQDWEMAEPQLEPKMEMDSILQALPMLERAEDLETKQ
jgi:hypothetical protein